jgi:hypothetical protein
MSERARVGPGLSYRAKKRTTKRPLMIESMEPRVLMSTYVVSNTNDSGAGSLRAAVLDASSNAGDDTITFDPSVFTVGASHTINLTGGELQIADITGITAIIAPAETSLTLDGGRITRIFRVDAGASLELQGLRLVNGNGSGGSGIFSFGFGGAILNFGNLDLQNCTFSGNSLVGDNVQGGAIFSYASGSCETAISLTWPVAPSLEIPLLREALFSSQYPARL